LITLVDYIDNDPLPKPLRDGSSATSSKRP